MYFAPDAPSILESQTPLLTMLQTLLSLFAPGSLRLSLLLLLDALLLTMSSVSFPPPTEPLAALARSLRLFRVLFYAKLSLSSLLSVASDVLSMISFLLPGSHHSYQHCIGYCMYSYLYCHCTSTLHACVRGKCCIFALNTHLYGHR